MISKLCSVTLFQLINEEIVRVDRSITVPDNIKARSITWLKMCEKEVKENSENG